MELDNGTALEQWISPFPDNEIDCFTFLYSRLTSLRSIPLPILPVFTTILPVLHHRTIYLLQQHHSLCLLAAHILSSDHAYLNTSDWGGPHLILYSRLYPRSH